MPRPGTRLGSYEIVAPLGALSDLIPPRGLPLDAFLKIAVPAWPRCSPLKRALDDPRGW